MSAQILVEPIKVLDHGFVRYVDHMGSDEAIVEAARQSTNKGFEGWEKDSSFLDFMYRKKHTSPFEQATLKLQVQAPIFVIREWFRHRTHSYNEMSARYTQMPNLHYVPSLERIKLQSKANKQGSGEDCDPIMAQAFLEHIEEEQSQIYTNYEIDLRIGIAKEVARINTPVSRYSRFMDTCNLLNWLKFLGLRMPPSAQWEIVQYANAIAEIVKEIWPRTYALFEEYDLNGVRFGATEMELLRNLLRGGKPSIIAIEALLGKSRAKDFCDSIGYTPGVA